MVPRRTRLTGRALIRSQGLREPVSADIQLDNALPGRVDEQGLPLYAVRIALKADPLEPGKLAIGPFEIDAADSRGAAGRWSGTAGDGSDVRGCRPASPTSSRRAWTAGSPLCD